MQRESDTFSSYEAGLCQLLHRMGPTHSDYSEVLVYQQRLIENINQTQRYGDTDARKAERSEIIDRLNEVALAASGIPFNRLCDLDTNTAAPELTDETTRLTEEEQQSIRKRLAIHQRNLARLEEQIALFGMTPPLRLLSERDYVQKQIAKLEQQLD